MGLADSSDVSGKAKTMLPPMEEKQGRDGKDLVGSKLDDAGSTTKYMATSKNAEPLPEGHPQDLSVEGGAHVANQQGDSLVEEANAMVEPLPRGLAPTGLRLGANIQASRIPGAYPGGASEPRSNVDYSVMVSDNTNPSQSQDPIGDNGTVNNDERLAHARPVAEGTEA